MKEGEVGKIATQVVDVRSHQQNRRKCLKRSKLQDLMAVSCCSNGLSFQTPVSVQGFMYGCECDFIIVLN